MIPHVIQINTNDGFFTEAPFLLDKYEKRKSGEKKMIEQLTYTQFCMKFTPTSYEPKDEEFKSKTISKNSQGWDIDDEMDMIATHDFDTSDIRHTLPKIIELGDVQP